MKITPRHKKWAKVILVVLTIRLVAGVLFHYVVVDQFKNLLQVVVQQESNGLYRFDATEVKFDLLAKNIILKQAVLVCTDTVNVSTHHQLTIPSMYLGIVSWKELLLHKRLLIDSMSVQLPSLKTHEHTSNKASSNEVAFHASTIFDMLQKLAARLEIRSFNIENGAYTYASAENQRPFLSNRINLFIKNFSRKNGQQKKLFSSDDLNLSMHDQHWVLPDGIHTVSFKRLQFSGKNQQFQLDSCTFTKAAISGGGGIVLSADKFFFNSKQLTAIRESQALILDTLVCVRPILSLLPAVAKDPKKHADDDVGDIIQQLFDNIHVKYLDIREGQFSIAGKTTNDSANVNRVNLKIYNLSVDPGKAPHILSDSINLTLAKILFYTRDSLYQLSMDEFSFQQQDVVLKNAAYGPTPRNRSSKSFTFTAPTLRLQDINLEDLMRKKLTAKGAMLYSPAIAFNAGGKKSGDNAAEATDKLFVALAGVRKLINVQDFTVVNGNLQFKKEGRQSLEMEMKNMDAQILLNQLLVSDSLVDIQRSLPMLRFSELIVKKDGVAATVSAYNFNGVNQHSFANSVKLSLANGTTVSVKQLSWQELDWNQLVNHQQFNIAKLGIQSMAIKLKGTQHNTVHRVPTELPGVHIGKVQMGQLSLQSSQPGTSFQFMAHQVSLEQVNAEKQFLTWVKPRASLSNFTYNDPRTQVAVYTADLRNNELQANQFLLQANKPGKVTKITLPVLTIKGTLHSTDFSKLHLKAVILNEPVIELVSYPPQQIEERETADEIPLEVAVEQLIINKGSVKQLLVTEVDTTRFETLATLVLKEVYYKSRHEPIAGATATTLELKNTTFKKPQLSVTIPSIKLNASNTLLKLDSLSQLTVSSGLKLNWQEARAALQPSAVIQVNVDGCSGMMEDDNFELSTGQPIPWLSMLPTTSITRGSLKFKNKAITAKANFITFNPIANRLRLQQLSMVPNLSEQATFATAKWQSDYITVHGTRVTLNGINWEELLQEDRLHFRSIEVDSTYLTTSRDKRLPFRHNANKMMPGKLITSIDKSFYIDSVRINSSGITVSETSLKTGKQGTIPITDLNAVVTGIGNLPGNDSIAIIAAANILNTRVSHFSYQESKADSLSTFQAGVQVEPLSLPGLSEVSKPMANINITSGFADTLYASWKGNKYGAVGDIGFFYKDLKIKLLDKNDPERKRFLLNIISSASRILLHRKNDDPSKIFFIRDAEKFVFNFWIKSLTSGIISSVGVKNSRKYIRTHRKVKEQYSLPDIDEGLPR